MSGYERAPPRRKTLAELRHQHAQLEKDLAEAEKHPVSDYLRIRQIKHDKLMIKDEIEARKREDA